MLDIGKVKENIILKKGLYYFDFAASGLGYAPIEDELRKVLLTYANTHSKTSDNAIITSSYYDRSRELLKSLLGLDESFYLIATGTGSTAAIKKFQELMGIYIPPATKEFLNIDKQTLKNLPLVVVSPYEHHSNEISYRHGLCEVSRVRLDKNGRVDFEYLKSLLEQNRGRKIIASFNLVSNITGVITDYKKLYYLIKQYGGIVALDGASYLPYFNVSSIYFDALFISSHKLIGGVGGVGLLAIKKSLCKGDEPTFAAGGTVLYVDRQSEIFTPNVEELEEGGTPGILQLIRSYLAFKLRNDIGFDFIKRSLDELKEYLQENLLKFNLLELYGGDIKDRMPIFALNLKGVDALVFSGILSQKFGIQTRAGCICAGPYLHDLLSFDDKTALKDKPSILRISLSYTHTKDDIDYLIAAIKYIIEKRGDIRFSQGKYHC